MCTLLPGGIMSVQRDVGCERALQVVGRCPWQVPVLFSFALLARRGWRRKVIE